MPAHSLHTNTVSVAYSNHTCNFIVILGPLSFAHFAYPHSGRTKTKKRSLKEQAKKVYVIVARKKILKDLSICHI